MPGINYDPVDTRVSPAMTPADAQGARYTPAIGEALENVGQQGSKLAADANRIQYMQKQADGVAALQKNISDGYRDFTQFAEAQKGQVGPNGVASDGTPYTDLVTKHIDDWSDQLVNQQTDPRLKRMAAEQARSMGDHFFAQASAWQVGTNRAWRVSSIDDGINSAASVVQQNPAMYDTLQKQQLDAVDAVASELHPEDKVALSNKIRSTFAEAASLGMAQNTPQTTVNVLTGQQPLPQGSIPSKIVSAANAKGVSPSSALAIAQFESGMKPDAQNPTSSANGLFQMLRSTGAQYYAEGANRADPDTQVDAGMRLLSDNSKALAQRFGRQPTTAELYSAHLLGLSGAQALADAPPTESFADLAGKLYGKNANGVVQANHFGNMNVGQVKAQIGQWMDTATAKTVGMANAPPQGEQADPNDMPPFLRALSPQGRQAILTHAQTLIKKDDAGALTAVQGQIKDTTAAYQRGEAVPNAPSFDTLVKAGMPTARATQEITTLNQWQQFGAQYAKVKTASPAEQEQILSQSVPVPGTPGYATAAETHDALQRAVQFTNQQRGADPIRYDQEAGLKTTQPLDMSNPQFLTGPLHSRFVQADTVASNSGTPYQPFSKQEAAQLGTFLAQAPAPQALQYLTSIAGAADSPEHYHAALAQLAPDHPTLAVAGQLALHNPQAASLVIQGDRMLKDKNKIPLPTSANFAQAWDASRGAAYQGLPQTSQSDMQAAIAHYVASQPAGQRNEKQIDADLWKKSIDAVAPSTNYNGRTTLVPAGSDPSKFGDTIAARWPQALAAAGLDAQNYPASAYSLASAGQDGVYVPYSGTMPLMAGGRRVVVDLNEPQAAAPGAMEPTAQTRNLKGKVLTLNDLDQTKRFK